MTKEQIQQQLIELYENQIMDLTMMSKIELGDDVIAEINRLQNMLMDRNPRLVSDEVLFQFIED